MKKTIKKSWMIASALTIGMAVLTPLQAGATSVEPTNGVTVQIEQQITGTITSFNGVGVGIKGRDGKNYYISFSKFSDEQLKQMRMNIVEGQEITVEGGVVEHYADFYTFEDYKKELPKNVPNEELTKLEKMFSEVKKLEKEASKTKEMEEAEKKYEEFNKIWEEMYKITKPYIIASWQPQPFKEFLENYGFSENNIVIAENDKKELKDIYEEWVKLEKDGQEEKSKEKMKAFKKVLQPYLDELNPPETFEKYIEGVNLEISTEDLAKLKDIYEDIQKAEKDDNYELYNKLSTEFYNILSQFIIPPTFEEYMSRYEFKVNKADSKQLKQLYEEILKLDKKEDSTKVEEKWGAFDNILEPYFEANREILISASKLTINGQEYLPR
ncbi:biotin-(acetyl-CoA carboxylase) ligase [Lysinibacillus parviboronicapiens]|uniref:Biotin-(Acetyl-CoA carboxylase) ligase n=1 Tax=Lysinibacillus parviboronicapiens TaxID=436516 RepID=A0ABV2PDM3_9BACI